ncbi:MAG: exodeoxyribonuclease V subunit gamma [Burkholderiaceae bacterium]|nr:exodeoxyribonuclease V subunit gamma [Burkholderiaceae bacterium]
MNPTNQTVLQPGFIAFHSNRSEDLAEVVINWIRRHPLNPLEEEVILVQSNGMAEWVKMELARIGGVCAATRVELPSRFLWRTYRQVLGRDAVPSDSPLDKVPMIWRLMQLLPTLIAESDFAPVAGFLKADEPDRMLQLAAKLADLFDQYQNYRADWLDAWAKGQDHLVLANGTLSELPPEQRWQPQLWRAVLLTLNEQQQQSIRPELHQRVLARLASGEPLAAKVAQRVIVFGMSQIPWTTLQALAALASHSQVMLAIPNPCRFYWGDIMDGRELLQSQRKRQPFRHGRDLSTLPLEDMHAHAHPLLASWGRQGRDFIRQLDVFDDAPQCQLKFDLARIDLFDETEEDAQTPLLKQVQNRIRDLTPLSEHVEVALAAGDHSIVFHSAHSKVRELEILHDQLLQLLAEPTTDAAMNPRDVIVMVPDIEQMAPAIRAVFGQYKRQDARFIPFDIADMSAKTSSPLIGALDWLLRLPQQRCCMSELVDLLEVSAVAARFDIEQASLPKLTQWMVGAGIRWGLNEDHRADLGLLACGDQNSAWFGLRRMLLGYASGAVGIDAPLADFSDIEPYAEVGGLEAELAGSLAHLLQALVTWWAVASTPATPETWAERGRALLVSMVKAESESDKQALRALEEGLVAWQLACEQAGFDEEVPLIVARSAWMEAMEVPKLNQRFRAGGVTFCTLMPMRAIPFEVVCLLGMNDGDYPRRGMRSDFDLMGLPGTSRPGDRSRRDDDRQLMLEALLSARRMFYVSWCGHSVRDNSEQPPSVLVSQLRDYLSTGWGKDAVSSRTTQHPLQPFSRRYFETGSPLLTYAREWRAAHEVENLVPPDAVDESNTYDETGQIQSIGNQETIAPLAVFVPDPNLPVTLNQLTQFLRNPVKAFFRQRLLVAFEVDADENADEECFTVDALEEYGLIRDLLATATTQSNDVQEHASVTRSLTRLRKAGELPLKGFGDLKQRVLEDVLSMMLQAWRAEQARFPDAAERQSVRLQAAGVVLEDWIDHLCRGESLADSTPGVTAGLATAWLELDPGKLLEKAKKPAARLDKLLGPWVRSLAIAAGGVSAQGVLVGRDGVVEITPMPRDEAQNTLSMLLAFWLQGMNAALPLPPKTALAWLADRDAASQYEGGYMQTGEVDESCLARMFPDFDALTDDGRFEALAQQVYEPLLLWATQHVTARFHNIEQALDESAV